MMMLVIIIINILRRHEFILDTKFYAYKTSADPKQYGQKYMG